MMRLFDEHTIRFVESLNGTWRFAPDPEDKGAAEKWYCGLPDSQPVIVPSVWNTEAGMLEYEGAAWYEKRFFSKGGCLRLSFGAVLTYAKVWLDGVYLGDHYGGFSQFSFIVPNISQGSHTLTVLADNRFDRYSIPQKRVDWYPYGGISRDVSIEELHGICVLENRLEYTLSEDLTSAKCQLVLQCYNAGAEEKTDLTVDIGDRNVYRGSISVPAGTTQTVTLPEFCLDSITLWEPGNPKLYSVCIKTDTDDLYDRVGFRHICVSDRKILLNGKPLQIRGINRHDDHPDFGFAFPPSRIKHDLDLITGLNCNAIRGAHYPNSQLFLDYLDELGILFWSEIPIWGIGFSVEALADPTVVERGLAMHKEMVRYYYNHPAIILWGMHNEIRADTEPALHMTKTYYDYLKANGGNRLVVYAANQYFTDICCAYSDVICVNQYYGWYDGDLPAWIPFLEQYCQRMESLGMADKPFIMSEFGGAALYGYHDAECTKWSEEYQAKLLRYCLKLFGEHPAVAGAFIWQFCDARTSSQMDLSRARGFNNKGIMNEYRRPKAAYFAVQEAYRQWMEQNT